MKKLILSFFIITFFLAGIECRADKIDFEKNIEGLVYYILDNNLVVKWTDDTVKQVRVTATDTTTADIYFNNTTNDKEILVPINGKSEIILSVGEISSEAKQYIINTLYNPDVDIVFGNVDVTNKEHYTITAIIKEPHIIEYHCNGTYISKTQKLEVGEHTIDVPLLSEKNDITVYVVDDYGNKKSHSVIVEKDITVPKLVISTDFDATSTYDSSICLTGSISDYKMLYINSKPILANPDGTFSYTYNLVDGENYISIQGVDEAGNIAEYYAVVTKLVKVQKNTDFTIPVVITIIALILLFFVGKYFIFDKKKGVQNEHERNSDEDSKAKLKKYRKDMIFKGISFIAPVLLIIILYFICFYGGTVKSTSMESSIKKGEYVLANKLAYVMNKPQRGDVIVFYSQEQKTVLLKRVIGIEGDEITFVDGEVFINGNICKESYLKPDIETNAAYSYVVPKGSVFVLGDNRENSIDSRHWKNPYISLDDIYGKLLFHF